MLTRVVMFCIPTFFEKRVCRGFAKKNYCLVLRNLKKIKKHWSRISPKFKKLTLTRFKYILFGSPSTIFLINFFLDIFVSYGLTLLLFKLFQYTDFLVFYVFHMRNLPCCSRASYNNFYDVCILNYKSNRFINSLVYVNVKTTVY